MKSAKRKSRKDRKKPMPRSVAHRLRSVRRALDGFSAVEVGRSYGDSARAVAYWVSRFKAHGEAGLQVLPRSGRPRKLSLAQTEKVRAYIARANERSQTVTGNSLAILIKRKFGISFTRQHCRRLITKLVGAETST